jgi:hypothetical protein
LAGVTRRALGVAARTSLPARCGAQWDRATGRGARVEASGAGRRATRPRPQLRRGGGRGAAARGGGGGPAGAHLQGAALQRMAVKLLNRPISVHLQRKLHISIALVALRALLLHEEGLAHGSHFVERLLQCLVVNVIRHISHKHRPPRVLAVCGGHGVGAAR